MAITRSICPLVTLLFLLLWAGCSSKKDSTKHPAYYIIDISAGPDASTYPAKSQDALPEGADSDAYKTGKIILKWIGPGKFTMGQAEVSLPRHQVTFSTGFYVGLYEITQAQWQNVMGKSEFKFADNPTSPAESISWEDIRGAERGHDWPKQAAVDPASFMGRLSAKVGSAFLFDLPTESQWEFACRAGTETEWSFGDGDVDEFAWTNENSEKETNGVGELQPNAWGLFDMHGNVSEWCLDRYGSFSAGSQTDPTGAQSGWHRVWRGGGWDVSDVLARSAHRSGDVPTGRFIHVGFRLAANPE